MSEFSEVVVILKNDETTVKQKFLCYDNLIDKNLMNDFVEEAKQSYEGLIDEVIVKISIQWE
jgi:hypothetical protein